ncbi:hypothetical protein GS416_11770 [Rhodococcus hoagii]|nr:hypothetical protein [Prescottella equi]
MIAMRADSSDNSSFSVHVAFFDSRPYTPNPAPDPELSPGGLNADAGRWYCFSNCESVRSCSVAAVLDTIGTRLERNTIEH